MIKIFFFFFVFSSFALAGEQQSGGSATYSKYNSGPYVGSCYSYVRTIVEEGKEDTSAGIIKSMYGVCTQNVSISGVQKNFKDSKGFVNFLSDYQYPNISKDLRFDLSQCEGQKVPPVHEIASRYYYLLSRIDNGQQSMVKQMSALSVAIGDSNFVKQLGCENSEFSEVKKFCKDAQSCSYNSNTLNKLAEVTDSTLKQISDLEKELKSLNLNLGRSQTTKKNKVKYQEQIQ